MSAICPNCRQTLTSIGQRCPELGCTRRGYHAVPADCVSDKLDPRVGLLLADKYLLVRMLGKGGMGVVMVALQQPLMREVALKVIHGVQIDDTMRARFKREAQAVAALDHPNVVKLVDFGVAQLDEEAPYMVMELASGAHCLRNVLADWRVTPPTWKGVAEVFSQVLAGLDAAHECGIIHRDVKPDNVMCKKAKGYDWFIKVLDFGLAKTFDPGATGRSEMASLTDAGAIVGTPQYMAPEQLSRLHFGPMDERVDVYAVGVMLFELLMGRRPYRETEPMTLVFAKLDPGRDPLLHCRELEQFGPMATVMRRAMAWAAADRYATADEFRAALADAIAVLGPDRRVVLAHDTADAEADLGAPTIEAAPALGRPKGRPSGPQLMATPAPNTGGFSANFTDLLPPAASPLPATPVANVAAPAAQLRARWLVPAVVGLLVVAVAAWLVTRKTELPPVVAAPAAATVPPSAAGAAAVAAPPAVAPAPAAPVPAPEPPPTAAATAQPAASAAESPAPAADKPTPAAAEPANAAKQPAERKVKKAKQSGAFDKF